MDLPLLLFWAKKLIAALVLPVDQLYRGDGQYSYGNGWNYAAIVAFVIAVLPNIPGFLNAAFPSVFPGVSDTFKGIYTYAWFVGLAIAAIVYGVLMKGKVKSKGAPVISPAVRA